MDLTHLLLYGLRSLWGILTPNVRKVSLNQDNTIISIFFYYDKNPTEEEIELSEEAASELISNYPEGYQVNCERYTIPFPEKILPKGNLLYARFEEQI